MGKSWKDNKDKTYFMHRFIEILRCSNLEHIKMAKMHCKLLIIIIISNIG